MTFFIGLDLGQSQDFTAISILERTEDKPYNYKLRHLERPALGTSYPDIVDRVSFIFHSDQLQARAPLVIDATGVGTPVLDMFKRAEVKF